ncbi:acetaldehyde dehydrogenase (acetylating) [Brevibacillus fluminis]|uniref:Acetaldehyde dehydrogenase (Acetylating) n=1 Tax=Brevibacillus fluminis TaxID=511487 RepID=A0A3M8DUF8_9BACL|nr:acetaldehyde dehydrogenase (acetylating) [Brevibacillus fluminis]RNB91732.1 acetaldehyde dehydrogenase (acetylating) [Brevibacillus fluminis]
MMIDTDLQSIQEVRDALDQADAAARELALYSQEQIDSIVKSMAQAAGEAAARLAALAVEETGFGNVPDKTAKNMFAARDVYAAIKEMKTVGTIHKDAHKKVWEIAQPFGVIAAIIPSTNPTSTVIYKALIALKAGNAIVFSPHPNAARCTLEAARVMQAAAERAGAPKGAIGCVEKPTLAATNELMSHRITRLILATGGAQMVKAAYSSGKPAYGVGPGNVPVYLHESADIPAAVRRIIQSKTFDNGTICASEQALIVDQRIRHKVIAEFKRQGAAFLDDHEKKRVGDSLVSNGGLSAALVGKSPQAIADIAGIIVEAGTKVLIAEEDGVGKTYPFSFEKLAPVLAMYTAKDQQEAEELCTTLLQFGGLGHTLGIHAESEAVVESFCRNKPASRIVVNAGTTFGGIGATTGILPSLTLGCGALGGNITSDNIGPQHLFNTKRVAYGIKEMEVPQVATEQVVTEAVSHAQSAQLFSKDELKELIRSVLVELKG